jgi:hypothetical protein
MPAFVKSPKFIIGAIVVLWVAFIIYANFQLAPVEVRLLPFKILVFQLRVSAVVIGSAIFGSVVTLVIQFLWNRRSSSKNAASAGAPSSSTTA